MSNYNIGQIRYSKGTEYLKSEINKIYTTTEEHEYDLNSQMGTEDLKITFAFEGLKTYYLKCSFNGFGDGIPQTFTIKLKTEDGKREQIIKVYELTPNDSTSSIELAFTPKTHFSKIVFELARSQQYDFMDGAPRKMTFNKDVPVILSSVVNILKNETLNLDSIFKLGIQGDAELIVCVNGEPIKLGKSGVFEVYREDFNIYSVGFIIDSKERKFIMDYCY